MTLFLCFRIPSVCRSASVWQGSAAGFSFRYLHSCPSVLSDSPPRACVLDLYHTAEYTVFLGQQFFGTPFLGNSAAVKHYDPVSRFYGPHAVGYDQNGPSTEKTGKSALHFRLVFHIRIQIRKNDRRNECGGPPDICLFLKKRALVQVTLWRAAVLLPSFQMILTCPSPQSCPTRSGADRGSCCALLPPRRSLPLSRRCLRCPSGRP